jgi:CheY-like chemotaxis protein
MPTALIIDDNRLNIDVLTMLLSKEGVGFSSVESPRYLSQTIDRMESIDVVFLDLEFPGSSGFKLLEQLKADPRLDGVPVVAYTVHIGKISEARGAGFHSFVGKPLNVQRFPNQLKRILSGISVWEA